MKIVSSYRQKPIPIRIPNRSSPCKSTGGAQASSEQGISAALSFPLFFLLEYFHLI